MYRQRAIETESQKERERERERDALRLRNRLKAGGSAKLFYVWFEESFNLKGCFGHAAAQHKERPSPNINTRKYDLSAR